MIIYTLKTRNESQNLAFRNFICYYPLLKFARLGLAHKLRKRFWRSSKYLVYPINTRYRNLETILVNFRFAIIINCKNRGNFNFNLFKKENLATAHNNPRKKMFRLYGTKGAFNNA